MPLTTKVDDFAGVDGTGLNGRVSGDFTWTRSYIGSGSTDALTIQANRMLQDSGGIRASYSPGIVPGTADYRAGAIAKFNSPAFQADTVQLRLGMRVDLATGAGYVAVIAGDSNIDISIVRRSVWGGAETTIGAPLPLLAYGPQLDHLFEFECVGTDLKVYAAGVLVGTRVDATYTGPGSPILEVDNGSTFERRWTIDEYSLTYDTPLPVVVAACFPDVTTAVSDPADVALMCAEQADPVAMILNDSCIPEAI